MGRIRNNDLLNEKGCIGTTLGRKKFVVEICDLLSLVILLLFFVHNELSFRLLQSKHFK